MIKEKKPFDSELFFKALADITRLRLINLMAEDEVCVCFFVEVLETNQPKISRHLAYLKRAGLVKTRREGNWMHYRLVEPPNEDAARIFREVRNYLTNDREMQKDRQKIVNVCCAPELPESIQGAPMPASLAGMRCQATCS